MLVRANIAGPSRENALLRDLLFPFYSAAQFCWLVFFTLIVFFIFRGSEGGALGYVLVAWCSGSLILTTNAPARLEAPEGKLGELGELLRRMQFVQGRVRGRWTYDRPAWMKWPNSDITVDQQDNMLILTGPMSTLKYISLKL